MPRLAEIAQIAEETCRKVSDMTHLRYDVALLDEFIDVAAENSTSHTYKQFGDRAKAIVATVASSKDATATRAFLRAALARTVYRWISDNRYESLPPTTFKHHSAQLLRIAKDDDIGAGWLDLADDRFQKDFGIASLRLYAACAQLVDPHCGISRSILFRGGISNAMISAKFLAKLGGFKPYFQIHTHAFCLELFTPSGWDECYRCCAELYALHPQIRGMFGSSWFYDPALDDVSPRLAYLRTVPLAAGAQLMFVQDGGEAITNATATSATRRQLYEDGRYRPRSYMLAWGRSDQIDWAERNP